MDKYGDAVERNFARLKAMFPPELEDDVRAGMEWNASAGIEPDELTRGDIEDYIEVCLLNERAWQKRRMAIL